MLLKKRGISVYTGASVEKIRPKDGLTCVFSQKGQTREEAADQILGAVGRRCDATALFAPDMTPQIVRGQLAVDEPLNLFSHIIAVGNIVSAACSCARRVRQAERALGPSAATLLPMRRRLSPPAL
jgi:dihydrolipoamide dehydrogenase